MKESTYGHIKGLFSPSEGANIINRGFGLGRWKREKTSFFDRKSRRLLEVFCYRYQRVGKPIILKNLRLSFEIGEFLDGCSNVIVISVRRDKGATFESILSARVRLMGSCRKWWSIVPPDMTVDKNDSAPDEIMQQIESFHCAIGRYSEDPRVFILDYDSYVADPSGYLGRLDQFVNSFIRSSAGNFNR